jgi:GDP-mannose pyrophosphatase NudK
MQTPDQSLAILIAGPYRSGTNDDPELIEANMEQMNQAALAVYRLGHLPFLGEWLALPLIQRSGSKQIGDAVFNEIFHPSSIRLLRHCDAVLRIGGPSKGADEMITIARELNKQVFTDINEIPRL